MKWITIFLFFMLCSGAYAFGLTPTKIDFGNVYPGQEYKGNFLLLNEEKASLALDVETTNDNLEIDEDLTLESEAMEQFEVVLNVPEIIASGEYEDYVVFRKKDSGEVFSFGKGVGLKVKYNVVGGNSITGGAVVEKEGNLEMWLLGGGVGVISLVMGLFWLRKRRLKNIY